MKVEPDYKNSVYNVPYTLLNMLGIRNEKGLREFRDIYSERIIFILIDALGFELFEKYVGDEIKCDYVKITSVFPSTTAAAITTIYTGLSPKEHGILEWYMYYEEYGNIIKTLPFTTVKSNRNDYLLELGYSPEPLFALPTISERVKNAGFRVGTYLRKEYANSSYSTHIFKGSEIFEYETLDDLFKKIRRAKADLNMLYVDYVDSVQHKYGPYSRETKEEVMRIVKYIGELREDVRDAEIVIVADHGQIEIRKKSIVNLGDMVGGSPRDLFIYSKKRMLEEYDILEKRDLLSLLGPGEENPRLRYRIPNYVVLPNEFEGVWFENFELKGLHGGLSENEMYVPFIVLQ